MASSKDYAEMTHEELVSEEKKMKSQRITAAVFVGLLIGIAVWSATHKGGFILTAILLISALVLSRKNSQNLKSIQEEITREGTVG